MLPKLVLFASLLAVAASFGGAPKKMPVKVYGGWFDGSVQNAAVASTTAAVRAGHKRIEISFPPVPNLEEVDFGTVRVRVGGTKRRSAANTPATGGSARRLHGSSLRSSSLTSF